MISSRRSRRVLDDVDDVAVRPLVSHALTRTQRTVSPQSRSLIALTILAARRLLLERRDGVLEVEEDHVGAEAGRLAEHLLAGPGDRQAGAARQVAGALRHGAEATDTLRGSSHSVAGADAAPRSADGVYVWLQPGGESGVSNAGVIVDDDGLTVVDTLMVRSQWEPFAAAVDGARPAGPAHRAHARAHRPRRRHEGVSQRRRCYASPQTSALLDQAMPIDAYKRVHARVRRRVRRPRRARHAPGRRT